MKGLNVRKLAAIAVGGALVGSALAPLAAAIDISKSDVVGASGAPVVTVVAGGNAAVSDVIWAGNIAAKVAQLATVDTPVSGGAGSANPTGLSVNLAIGGSTSYSSEYSKTFDGTSYAFNNTSASAAEFIKEASSGQLPFLVNSTKSYRYNGSTYNIAVKETVGIEADARLVTNKDIKDLVVYMENVGDFNYVLDLGDGIPAVVETASTTKFTDGSNDNVVIPFMGDEFTVQEVDLESATKTINLIKESAKANYNEGDTIPGLVGRGSYAGEEMSVKIAAVTQSSATATYEARVDLADSEGNIVDSQTLAAGNYLNKNFLDATGGYALETVVYVSAINIEPTTSKGVITMVVGKNVVTLANNKQYPYDSTDTDTTNDYWMATIDDNGTTATTVGVKTVKKIVVKNKVEAWNLSNPLWSSDDSLTQAGKDAAAAGGDTAHFLQGNETALGYDFVKVKFDGFKNDQDKTTIKVGNGNMVYYDSDSTKRTIPFYIKLSDLPQTEPTEQSFSIDTVTFYAKCYKPTTAFSLDVYDGNLLNGSLVRIKPAASAINVSADGDGVVVDIDDANSSAKTIDLNGVQFTATVGIILADGVAGATLQADGNCSYSSTSWEATPTYLTVNSLSTWNQITTSNDSYKTVYFDDDNSTRTPGDLPINFAKEGSLADTYNYRQYYSSQDGYVYLLLDNSTGFSNTFSNADANFVGTDPFETGDVGFESTSTGYLPYYWPDMEAFGNNDATDNSYIVALFGVQADSTAGDDFRVHVDTATGNLVQYPNDQLSNYTADVNQVSQTQPAWVLKARTDSDSALYAGYLEYGSKAELTDDMETATFTIPEAQIYLSLSVLGEGAVQTVAGGETAEGVKANETVTIGGKDITVAAINYTAGTCTVEGSSYPKVVPVGQLVYTDSPAPAGNHVIVGGYLVNKLAENVLLGDGMTLQETLTAPGDIVVELLSSGDIVVAGYTAADTKAAAQELIAALDALG